MRLPDAHRKNQCSCSAVFGRERRHCIFAFESDDRCVFTCCYQTTTHLHWYFVIRAVDFCSWCVAWITKRLIKAQHTSKQKLANVVWSSLKACQISGGFLKTGLWVLGFIAEDLMDLWWSRIISRICFTCSTLFFISITGKLRQWMSEILYYSCNITCKSMQTHTVYPIMQYRITKHSIYSMTNQLEAVASSWLQWLDWQKIRLF